MKKLLILLLLLPSIAFADERINWASAPGSAARFFARSGDVQFAAMPFTPASNESSVALNVWLAKEGAGRTDNVVFIITADSGGAPTGVNLGSTSTIAAFTALPNDNVTECGGSQAQFISATTTGLSLVGGTKYWAIVKSDGADGAVATAPYICQGATTPKGAFLLEGSASWTADPSNGFAGFITLAPAATAIFVHPPQLPSFFWWL